MIKDKLISFPCEICGKFISYRDIEEDKAIITHNAHWMALAEGSDENMFSHKKCIQRKENEK